MQTFVMTLMIFVSFYYHKEKHFSWRGPKNAHKREIFRKKALYNELQHDKQTIQILKEDKWKRISCVFVSVFTPLSVSLMDIDLFVQLFFWCKILVEYR